MIHVRQLNCCGTLHVQFERSSEFTGSDLDSDAYQVAEKAKKLANDVTALAGQLQKTRTAEQRRPLMPLVCCSSN